MKALTICLSPAGIISIVPLVQAPQLRKPTPGPAVGTRTNIPHVDVKTTIDALQDDLLPTELKAKTSAERERMWPGWVTNRDRTICARAAQGDEDSIFNLLLFGAAFTKEPRVPECARLRAQCTHCRSCSATSRRHGGRSRISTRQ